jgi:hypothetical protein
LGGENRKVDFPDVRACLLKKLISLHLRQVLENLNLELHDASFERRLATLAKKIFQTSKQALPVRYNERFSCLHAETSLRRNRVIVLENVCLTTLFAQVMSSSGS